MPSSHTSPLLTPPVAGAAAAEGERRTAASPSDRDQSFNRVQRSCVRVAAVAGARGLRGRKRILRGSEAPTERYTMNGYGLYSNIVRPPYTTLTSYDLNKGTIKWQVPLGDDPRLASLGITGTGTAGDFKFGVIPTITGLVFVAGGDDKLHVYDADTGKQLWERALGAASRGIPSMYEQNGRQYPVDDRVGSRRRTQSEPAARPAARIRGVRVAPK